MTISNKLLQQISIACLWISLSVRAVFSATNTTVQAHPPHVLFIYVDDLGYGDVACLNSNSKIKTPNLDQLAMQGIYLTDAHSPDTICLPSRYALMTGRYCWRTGLMKGNGAPLSESRIKPGRFTISQLFKSENYNTAIFGKWGIRFFFRDALKDGVVPTGDPKIDDLDFSKPIEGAERFGFDYTFNNIYFGKQKDGTHYWFENGYPIHGKTTPDFSAYDYSQALPIMTQKAIEYLETLAGKRPLSEKFYQNRSKPFFIYYAPPVPHEPIVPTREFKGKSGAGLYGDFVEELDAYVGKLLTALETNGFSKNTIVVFSSDNGPEATCYQRIKKHEHYSMGSLRGCKKETWEGGHRVPFFVKWPGHITPGSVSHEPICLTDMLATFADILGIALPEDAGEDSFSILPALLGKPFTPPLREPIVYHAGYGTLAVRSKEWVFVEGHGGKREPAWFRDLIGAKPFQYRAELFNLNDDPKQTDNLYRKHPEKSAEMKTLLETIQKKGKTK